jgi:response regulator RpfG family c-di-GMP phosphodiesterase
MSEKVLCVDDEPQALEAYRRGLRKQFQIDTALGGEQALQAIAAQGPYAVVVADMRMPLMDGIQLLSQVKDRAPNTVRMMLTGDTDLQTAIHAVNDGSIFRFLSKPCTPEILSGALEAGIQQYRLVLAEKDLLERTLWGSIEVLTEVLSLVNPTAFSRAARMRPLVSEIAAKLQIQNVWEIEVAAMLSQVGCVTVPEETLLSLHQGRCLTLDELRMCQNHPKVGYDLIARIPRLEAVAGIIAYQEKLFDGNGFPDDAVRGINIPQGARILKLTMDFDRLVSSGSSKADAMGEIQRRLGWYDPNCIEALRSVLAKEVRHTAESVKLEELTVGMVLAEDLFSAKGFLLVAKGQVVTAALSLRIANLLSYDIIRGEIKVLIPIDVK